MDVFEIVPVNRWCCPLATSPCAAAIWNGLKTSPDGDESDAQLRWASLAPGPKLPELTCNDELYPAISRWSLGACDRVRGCSIRTTRP
ncbi:MAG: hypothetical protein U5N10_01330 [Gemmobacter sp.]|nr:hypothetical protein [Gemmobacter sp.]